MKRRVFIRLSALLCLSSVTSKSLSQQSELTDTPYRKVGTRPDRKVGTPIKDTPSEIQGPFYPLVAQSDKDFDLTKIKGKSGLALGTHAYIEGAVFDVSGNSIENVTVDLWQANSHGRYRHPHDSSNAPLDENFQGWAIVKTNKYGKFRFKTVIPGPYNISSNWQRPPHIHFKVSKLGYEELVTQMYFEGQTLNTTDRLLQKKSPKEQELIIAKKAGEKKSGLDVYHYKIVLNPA